MATGEELAGIEFAGGTVVTAAATGIECVVEAEVGSNSYGSSRSSDKGNWGTWIGAGMGAGMGAGIGAREGANSCNSTEWCSVDGTGVRDGFVAKTGAWLGVNSVDSTIG